MKKGRRQHKNSSKNRRTQKPPYFKNKNTQFEQVRKRMKMKTDGPTLNEMSHIDATTSFEEGQHKEETKRPVSTQNQIKGWFSSKLKEIIIGAVSSIVGALLLYIVIDHSKQLVGHDKDLEHLQDNDKVQDVAIEKLKDKTNEMNTDIRLIEQRIDYSSEKKNRVNETDSVNIKKK